MVHTETKTITYESAEVHMNRNTLTFTLASEFALKQKKAASTDFLSYFLFFGPLGGRNEL